MTSEEIRETELLMPKYNAVGSEELHAQTNALLREIAAQLADLNQGLFSLSAPDGPRFNVHCHLEALSPRRL